MIKNGCHTEAQACPEFIEGKCGAVGLADYTEPPRFSLLTTHHSLLTKHCHHFIWCYWVSLMVPSLLSTHHQFRKNPNELFAK